MSNLRRQLTSTKEDRYELMEKLSRIRTMIAKFDNSKGKTPEGYRHLLIRIFKEANTG